MPGINLHSSRRSSSHSHSQNASNDEKHHTSNSGSEKKQPANNVFRQFDLRHQPFLTKRGKTIHHVVLRVFVIADGKDLYLFSFHKYI